jgi:hypothetical protein
MLDEKEIVEFPWKLYQDSFCTVNTHRPAVPVMWLDLCKHTEGRDEPMQRYISREASSNNTNAPITL